MNRFSRAALLLAVVLVAACDGGPASDQPRPGDLLVSLSTPNADDRALLVSIAGPEEISAVAAASPAFVVHTRTQGTTTRVAVFGSLADGPVLRLTVPDTRRAAEYTATVLDAADGGNADRAATGYALGLTAAR
jgi:hypothetical protein